MGVFSIVLGVLSLLAPSSLQGVVVINALVQNQPLGSLFVSLLGPVSLSLGVLYMIAGLFLWSPMRWSKGAYLAIIVAVIGTIEGGLAATFAPGAAASGMVINVLLITLIATETWEERLAASMQRNPRS